MEVDLNSSQRLAALLLGEPLEHWIRPRRGDGMSWATISRQLARLTDGQVDVSHETLRRWYGDDLAEQAS